MNARERILSALAHRESDRLPVDIGSMRSTGIMAVAYNRLKAALGVTSGRTLVYDLVQQLAEPEPWFLERFRIDAIDIGRAMPDRKWKPWVLPDGSSGLVPEWFEAERDEGGLTVRDRDGVAIGRMPDSSMVIDQVFWPMSGEGALNRLDDLAGKMQRVIWAALPASPWDRPLTPERAREIGRAARCLHDTTEFALLLSVGCNLFEWSQFLFGMENAFVYMAREKAAFMRFLETLAALHLANLETLLPHVRGCVHVLVFGDDLGTQRGSQISRRMYRELFFPFHKLIFRRAKELSGAHIFLHSCGGVRDLIPDFVEVGVEILNPVQTSARNMEPNELKREFGKTLTFWGGGCDTQHVLSRGTPGQVRDDVRRRIEILGPGGGFVWAPVHNITAEVPAENIIAMLDAAREFG